MIDCNILYSLLDTKYPLYNLVLIINVIAYNFKTLKRKHSLKTILLYKPYLVYYPQMYNSRLKIFQYLPGHMLKYFKTVNKHLNKVIKLHKFNFLQPFNTSNGHFKMLLKDIEEKKKEHLKNSLTFHETRIVDEPRGSAIMSAGGELGSRRK